MDSKVVVALVSVSLGWILSQLTDFVHEKRKAKRIREAFDAELEDMALKLDNAVQKCTKYRDNLTPEIAVDMQPLSLLKQSYSRIIFIRCIHSIPKKNVVPLQLFIAMWNI